MGGVTYQSRRGEIEAYFDRTAAAAWTRLTSDAPVGRIRATVRAGRDEMRRTLLDWLPADLRGARLLDAGCGTGALAVEAARRGAQVLAIDLSPTLTDLARSRAEAELAASPGIGGGGVEFKVGDMHDATSGRFDHVVAMDSLIHYPAPDVVRVIEGFAARARGSVLLTFAPRNAALALMLRVGRLFPKGNSSPAIEPIAEQDLRSRLGSSSALGHWQVGRTQRVASGFYTSQALELRPR
jgi:magnesium-protoporphyrin O-methyltransferase